MQKKITFFIMSTTGAPVKQASVSRAFLFFLAVFVMGMLVALGYGIYDYHHLKIASANTEQLEKQLVVHKDEIKLQRKQIQTFADEINALKAKLMALNEFERKIRIIANLENTGPDQMGLFGIGGSIPEALNSKIDLEEKHNELTRAMHEQTEQINIASTIQERSFEDLLKRLESQRNILACTPAIRPAKGMMTSNFGYRISPFTNLREFHKGYDIANRVGTEVVATANGTVISTEESGFWGRVITINHGHGMVTRYAHLDKFLKKQGDTVKRGEVIGLMGNSGRSTGPHVHYEIILNGANLNPEKYFMD